VQAFLRSLVFLPCLLSALQARSETVTFPTANPEVAGGHIVVTGVLTKPGGLGPFPSVVLLHTCGGLQGHVANDWPKFLATQGYVALAVDSFGSRGLGPCPNALVPPRPGTKTYASGAMISDAHGALEWLERQEFAVGRPKAVMGFSLGGMAIHLSLLRAYANASRARAFDIAIVLYGPCAVRSGAVAMRRLNRSPLPLLEIIGARDERILRECRRLLPEGPWTELHILPDAYHNFDNPRHRKFRHSMGGSPMLFSAEATEMSRDLVKRFLARRLSGSRAQ